MNDSTTKEIKGSNRFSLLGVGGLFAWRYFRAKKTTNAINIISWISIVAIMVGTAALILVLSVFNGFEGLVKSLYSSFYPDLKISPETGKNISLTTDQLQQLRSVKGIKNISLVVEEKALLTNGEAQANAVLKGVDANYTEVAGVADHIIRGEFNLGTTDAPRLVLGAGVENAVGVQSDRSLEPLLLYTGKKGSVDMQNPLNSVSSGQVYAAGTFIIQQEFDNKYVLMFCGILYFGGRWVLGGTSTLEASSFITYLALFYNIITPAKSLSTSFSNMQKGSAAIGRIEEVLKTHNTIDENEGGQKLTDFTNSIELRNVSFSYDGVPILKNINLKIEKGKTIALVGSSGAGKSTLADLIPRFHDVTSGELLIDGVNIKDYSLHSVRDQISIVTQEPILFNDTIAANIRIGKGDATETEIEEAATIANAHNYITKKDIGYNTNIGDRGTKLSGGERQRLTIARAVIKNPPILILDEATSSLDTESERLVDKDLAGVIIL